MKEYLLTTDEFNKPKTVEGKRCNIFTDSKIILLEKILINLILIWDWD